MHDRDGGSPWKPRGPRPPHDGAPRRESAPRGSTRREPVRHAATQFEGADNAHPARERRDVELRLHGLNAVRAMFARRPQALRKLYLAEARIPQLQPLLKWCVAHRVGYRVVDDADLQKLAASAHHEGVVAEVLREEPLPLSSWLRDLPAGPQCALWLDGVGNPHNLGAILRSAAHFGVAAILLPKHSTLALSGAAVRVAEGGAEAVPLVRLGREDNSIAQLRSAGFGLAATVVRGGQRPVPSQPAVPVGLRAGRGRRGHVAGVGRRLRPASVDPRQRRGGKPQRGRGDRGAAGGVGAATVDVRPARCRPHACDVRVFSRLRGPPTSRSRPVPRWR